MEKTQYEKQSERYNQIKAIISNLRNLRENNRQIEIKLLSSLLYAYLKEQGYQSIDRKLIDSFLDDEIRHTARVGIVSAILKVLQDEKLIRKGTREKQTLCLRRNLLVSNDDSYKRYGCKSISGNKSILAYHRTDIISCFQLAYI